MKLSDLADLVEFRLWFAALIAAYVVEPARRLILRVASRFWTAARDLMKKQEAARAQEVAQLAADQRLLIAYGFVTLLLAGAVAFIFLATELLPISALTLSNPEMRTEIALLDYSVGPPGSISLPSALLQIATVFLAYGVTHKMRVLSAVEKTLRRASGRKAVDPPAPDFAPPKS